MFKRVHAWLMICIFSFSLVGAHHPEEQNNSKVWKNALFGAVAVGAAYSLMFWLPQTKALIENFDFWYAVQTTHVPRVALDAATIAACAVAIHEINKEEQPSKKSRH